MILPFVIFFLFLGAGSFSKSSSPDSSLTPVIFRLLITSVVKLLFCRCLRRSVSFFWCWTSSVNVVVCSRFAVVVSGMNEVAAGGCLIVSFPSLSVSVPVFGIAFAVYAISIGHDPSNIIFKTALVFAASVMPAFLILRHLITVFGTIPLSLFESFLFPFSCPRL